MLHEKISSLQFSEQLSQKVDPLSVLSLGGVTVGLMSCGMSCLSHQGTDLFITLVPKGNHAARNWDDQVQTRMETTCDDSR